MIGRVKDWHSPNNPDCAHNTAIENDCTCKLVIRGNGKKRHKARMTFRVVDYSVSGHKIKPQLVAELHDDGKLIIRESGRRISYETTLGKIYSRLVWSHAMQIASESKRKRKEARRAKLLPRYARKSKTRGSANLLLS